LEHPSILSSAKFGFRQKTTTGGIGKNSKKPNGLSVGHSSF
jgi:hypothetical protein